MFKPNCPDFILYILFDLFIHEHCYSLLQSFLFVFFFTIFSCLSTSFFALVGPELFRQNSCIYNL